MSLSVKIKKQFKKFSLDISFESDNEYVALLGASGSGKSLTLKCIAGVETPDEGLIVLNGRTLFDSERKINLKPQERNVGYLFQNYALFPNMTVEENIGVGLKFSKNENKKIVEEMIDIFHLNGLEKQYPLKLSGGQQQRVALARCIAYKPDVLMLDEPFSALDSHLKENIQTEVLELLKYYDGEVLLVTHSMDEAYKFCENVLIIEDGRAAIYGNSKNIFENPKSSSAAKIIGCQNTLECDMISDNSVYIPDWNFVIHTDSIVSSDIKYVGIHSHSFKISNEEKYKTEENIMKCKIVSMIEGMYEYSIKLENMDKKNNTQENITFIYKIKKEDWKNRESNDILYIKIPKESVLLLTY